jgi:hypothetical protein
MTVESQGFDVIEPEQYLGPKSYKFHYRCAICGTEYSRTCKAPPKKDPPCPNTGCEDKARIAELEKSLANLTRMLESGVPPAQIGHKVVVKAVDETAKVVMEDYGMTNLRDNVGPGEAVAPKLPAPQQAQADAYFGAQGGFKPHQIPSITGMQGHQGLTKAQTDLLGRRALSGAFRNMATTPGNTKIRGQSGESPLTRVGIEKLK